MKLSTRWNEMDLFRKGLLILMLAAIPLFAVVTAVQCSRVGIEYGNAFLRRTETDGVVQYAGRKDGQDIAFTVYPDGQVEHRWGNETYGPYMVREDPSAAPEPSAWSGDNGDRYVPDGLLGVEIRQGDTVLFRGGWDPKPDRAWFNLYDESGEQLPGLSISAITSNGTVIGPDGEIITPREQHEPTAAGLLRVALAPELVHRGSWKIYALVTLLAAAGMGYILFYRELFYWDLEFTVKNPENAEPSDWYVFSSLLGMGIITAVVLVLYVVQAYNIFD